MDYIQPYLDYFSQHPDWAIAIIFLIAFGEALLIIGLFVPSTAVLVGAGILVGTGHLAFWPVFGATAIGAIAGDQISYWAGRLYGQRLKTMWPLNRYAQLVLRGEDFVRNHGGKSIAVGRFVPGVKAVVPGIVGMLGMGQIYFAAVNVTSGLVWSAAHVLPGMLIGQGLAFAGELSGRLVIVLLILLVTVAVAGYVIRLLAAGLSPYLNHLLGRIAAWARSKESRSMRRFARAISPDNPRSLLIVLFAAVFFTGLIALVDLVSDQLASGAVSNVDVSIFNLMQEMRNAPADELMITLTMLGDGWVITAVAAAMIVWLFWHRAHRAALAALIAILAGKLFVPILKSGIQRPRPIELYNGSELFSFPSGHATMSALTFGVLAVLVSHAMGRWGRSLVYAICAIMVVAIAYSRVYLGAHWFSDVAGGLLFGTVMAAAFAVAIEAIPPRRIRPVGLFGASIIAFLAAGSIHVGLGFPAAEQFYAPPQKTETIDLSTWTGEGWKKLPARRVDLVGGGGEPFVAQWAGNLDSLERIMVAEGWTVSPKWTWRDAIPYLDPHAELGGLAPRPALHEGLKAKLTMIEAPSGTPPRRLVLRVYKSNEVLVRGAERDLIYLVSLTRESLRRGFSLYAMPSPLPALAEDREGLATQLRRAAGVTVLAEATAEGAPLLLLEARP